MLNACLIGDRNPSKYHIICMLSNVCTVLRKDKIVLKKYLNWCKFLIQSRLLQDFPQLNELRLIHLKRYFSEKKKTISLKSESLYS